MSEMPYSERIARMGSLNAPLFDGIDYTDDWMPIVQAYNGPAPVGLVSYTKARSCKGLERTVHFYLYDAEFESVWTHYGLGLSRLKKYASVLMPDFSTLLQLPPAVKMYNVLRNKVLAQRWQKEGVKVIPSVSWGEYDSFDYCFDGFSRGGLVAVNTVGTRKRYLSRKVFLSGLFELERRLEPERILFYGDRFDVSTRAEQLWYQSETVGRWSRSVKKFPIRLNFEQLLPVISVENCNFAEIKKNNEPFHRTSYDIR